MLIRQVRGDVGGRTCSRVRQPFDATVTRCSRCLAATYAYYVFPPGFSAHWVRFITDADCNATAWLQYT